MCICGEAAIQSRNSKDKHSEAGTSLDVQRTTKNLRRVVRLGVTGVVGL